jgi:hypothetical protein
MILQKKHDINAVLIGMVLGDSCIANPRVNPYLTTEHSIKQLPYLEWKRELLKSFLDGGIKPTKRNGFYWQTSRTSRLKYLYQDFYRFPYVGAKNRIKKVNRKLLNRLTTMGLAIWICDDGSLCKRDRVLSLSTFNFQREGNEIIQQWFKDKFNLEPRILRNTVKNSTPENEWFLRFTVKDTKTLLDITGPIIKQIPSMEYKAEIRSYKKKQVIT